MHEGFWLGCLTPDDLNAITADHFDQSRFYASAEHNLGGFFTWEKDLVERHFPPTSRILVAAAGGGREVLALRKAGFEADGFECSTPLVDASRQIFDQAGQASYITYCPPDRVPDGLTTYDGILVGWGAYTHIPTRTRRVSFLQALRKCTKPQAPLLLSYFTRRADSADAIAQEIAKIIGVIARPRKESFEVGDRISFARYVHSFTRDELEEELKSAGFQMAEYHDSEEWGYAVGIAQ